MWFIKFKRSLSILLVTWFFCIFTQSLGRLYLVILEARHNITMFPSMDLFQLFWVGFKFDVRSASILISVFFAILLIVIFTTKLYHYWYKLLPFIVTLIFFVTLLMTMVSVFYYRTYGRHIDVFIFGLVDDDTTAIIETLLADYPVITLFTILLAVTVLFFYCIKRWQRYVGQKIIKKSKVTYSITYIFVTVMILGIGCRGSLGTFPLREANAQVSDIRAINMFVPNGLIALAWAYKDYKADDERLLVFNGDITQPIQSFYGENRPHSISIFDRQLAINDIAQNSPPHVILSVMESMGSHLFEFDDSQNDLLGALRPHWQNDWVFKRFISEGNGTIDSLNRFFVRSPINNISQSSAQFIDFHSNMFKPFLKNGYKVIFITPGNGAWRNLNLFLPHLGVSEFIEQSALLKQFPQAEVSTWGISDEYMFKYAQWRLDEAEKNGEHLFIMMMSVTNHAPFKVPETQKTIQFQFTPDKLERLSGFGSTSEINSMFNTFYYSNDQLGKFISNIKGSVFADHTIIAFTGDHNMRGIGYIDPQESALAYGVPFYLYVPKFYQNDTHFEPSRIGSHKDIFPTLYALSLSDTSFYQMGCNLLSGELDPLWCQVGYNPDIVIDIHGSYFLRERVFRPWRDIDSLRVLNTNELYLGQTYLEQTMAKWRGFSDLLNWQISEQIHSEKYQQ